MMQHSHEGAKVYVVHVYNSADQLRDYYVYTTLEGALRQAAIDVVEGRFEGRDFVGKEVERTRVLNTVRGEPGVRRHHVCCDGWWAHVDEMRVLF